MNVFIYKTDDEIKAFSTARKCIEYALQIEPDSDFNQVSWVEEQHTKKTKDVKVEKLISVLNKDCELFLYSDNTQDFQELHKLGVV